MRELAYHNPYRNAGHYCPNVLLRCVDFRFHVALEELLATSFIHLGGTHDHVSMAIPGGALAVTDEYLRQVVFKGLELATRRNEAQRLIVADHVDCLACGGSSAHTDARAELDFHIAQLQEACQLLRAAHPRLEVVLLYQDWDRIFQVDPG